MAEIPDTIPDDERTHAELADLVMPALLRGAREAYRVAVRSALAAGGYDDLPPNGAFVVGAVTNHGVPLADAVSGLRVSKQAASQLVDALVTRGYVERRPDEADRRRVVLTVTERGAGAAECVQAGVGTVDAQLRDLVGADGERGLRRGLAALAAVAARQRNLT
jgi:DNA-binding MarR family transcriptional regulator